jgi:hypothetical protein
MTLHVSVGGVSKKVIAIWVGVNGAWKKVLNGYTSISAVYKKFFSTGDVVNPLAGGTLAAQTLYLAGGGTSFAQITFATTGGIEADAGGDVLEDTVTGTRWFTDSPDQTYEIFGTIVSSGGSGTIVGTFGSWLPLTSDRTFGVTRTGTTGGRSVTAKFKIRRQSDAVVVSPDTNSYFMSAVVMLDDGGGGGGGETP